MAMYSDSDEEKLITSEIYDLNNRPKASTNFENGATTATVGEYIVFGQNIGYVSTQCTDGYWPSGPVCPVAVNDHQIWSIQPAPEMTESKIKF